MSENFSDAALTVGVVGLGYVGLPLAVHFAEAGNDVIAVDVDYLKIEAIGRGESYIEDVASSRLVAAGDRIGVRALREAREGRRDHHLCADAVDGQPRAGPRAAAAVRPPLCATSCRPGSS